VTITVAAAAGHFGPDVAFNLSRIDAIVREAAGLGADLLVLPHGVLSGYHDHLGGPPGGPVDLTGPGPSGEPGGPGGSGTRAARAVGAGDVPDLPRSHRLDGAEVAAVVATVRAVASGRLDGSGMVVCFGMTEDVDGDRANTAVCVDAGGVLGVHRKVHLPAGEVAWYRAGDGFAALDTPVGRLGLLVDYDKTFPESARELALDGAEVLVCPSAWPASRTNRADTLVRDRQRRLFDLYDRARAAENQVWLVSANQTGRHGALRFLGQSKVVRPDGEVVVSAGARAGLVTAGIDPGALHEARRRFHHLKERRPDLYRATGAAGVPGVAAPSPVAGAMGEDEA
jgi:predicted amidohydrolase